MNFSTQFQISQEHSTQKTRELVIGSEPELKITSLFGTCMT